MTKESPMARAWKDIPQAWYEVTPNEYRVISTSLALVGNIAYYMEVAPNHDSVPLHLVGAAIFLISTIADRYSTVKALDTDNKAREVGLNVGTGETNPFVKGIKDPEKFNGSKKVLALDIFGTVVSGVYPGLGAGLTLSKFHASAVNMRHERRSRRATEIARSQ